MGTREKVKDPNTLTLQELEILQKHTIEGKSGYQTAHELGISRDTVKRAKRKPAYHEMAQAALEQKGYTVERLVGDLIDKTTAKKCENMGGSLLEVEDNVSQIKALTIISKIYGVEAPQQINLNSLAGASDDELIEELNEQLAAATAGAQNAKRSEEASDASAESELD